MACYELSLAGKTLHATYLEADSEKKWHEKQLIVSVTSKVSLSGNESLLIFQQISNDQRLHLDCFNQLARPTFKTAFTI